MKVYQKRVDIRQILSKGFALALMISISLLGLFVFVPAPVQATTLEELKLVPPSERPTSEEAIERAYEFGEGAGIREEVYQQKVQKGENPATMPKPYRRDIKADKTAVPETSLLEETIDKGREVIEKVTGKD